MRPAELLVLAAPLVLASPQLSELTNIVNGITSVFGDLGGGLSTAFAEVTSIGGSVYTVVTAAVPTEAQNVATQVTSIGGSLYTVITSDGNRLASEFASVGTQVTSYGGSLYTLVTSAAPGALSSLSAEVTSLNGTLATVLAPYTSVGTKTTTMNGSTFTVATNPAGQVVSTVTAATTTSSHSGGAAAMVTKAPVLAGGVLGAGLAVVAFL